jgi:hypothetical protein
VAKLTKAQQAEREIALNELREILPEGSTVFCILRSVAKSGMSREITFMTLKGGEPYYLDYRIGQVLDLKRGKSDGLKVHGAGMDMGFHVVHNLSYALHGYPTTDNENRRGYTLTHRWM